MSAPRKVTPAQRDLILTLLEERVVPQDGVDRLMKSLRISEDPEEFGLSMTKASSAITWLKRQPKHQASRDGEDQASRARKPSAVEAGVYETEAGIYVVKRTRDKQRVYAKKLVELRDTQGDRLTECSERARFDFEYAPGAIYTLTEDDRMPLERAKELTVRYGRCINCGRRLKVAESLERGLGPVCVKAFGPRQTVELPVGAVGQGVG